LRNCFSGIPARRRADHPDRYAHSTGIAWLVIVAAEMLVGVRHWLLHLNEWNKPSWT
jgi:hypothetical protein